MNNLRVFLTVLIGFTIALGAARSEVPEWIESRSESGRPLWVSAEYAVVGGQIQRSLLSETDLEVLDRLISTSDELRDTEKMTAPEAITELVAQHECNAFSALTARGTPAPFEKVFADAEIVVKGTIRSKKSGFLSGHLSAIYELEVEIWSKAPTDLKQPTTIYFVYPEARILIEGKVICQRGPRFPEAPKVGLMAIIMTSSSNVIHADPLILLTYDEHLYFETQNGAASVATRESRPASDGKALGPNDWRSFELLLSEANTTRNSH